MEAIMHKKMMVAYDESQEPTWALRRAIELAKVMGAELRLVTVSEPLPAYVAYADVAFPGSQRMLAEERQAFYSTLQEEAKAGATENGVGRDGVVGEGGEGESICNSIPSWEWDLLV